MMKIHQTDFSNQSVTKSIMYSSFPLIVAELVNLLYSQVDRIYISHMEGVGAVALTGVGLCLPIISLISAFARLYGSNGGGPLCAIELGRGNNDEAEKYLSSSFSLTIITGIIITIAVLVFCEPILYLFGASDQTFPYAESYLMIYALGSVPVLVSLTLTPFINALGYSSIGMIGVVIGAGANIILDPVFIFLLDFGVRGAAIATVISQAASFAITITSLISSKARIRLRLTAPRGYIVKKTVKLGLSPFIIIATDSLIMIILNTILQMYGGEGLGDKLLTCSTIIQSYHLLVMNPLGGITGGSQGLLSYSYGAGRTDRVRSTYLHVQVLATIYTVLMMIFSWTNARFFIQLFTSDEEIIQLSIHYLKIFTAMIIPLSFQYNTVDTFTALGKSEISLPLSLFRKLVFTVSIFIIPYITKEAGSAFFAEPASDIISSLVSTTTLLIMLPRVLRERTSRGLSI